MKDLFLKRKLLLPLIATSFLGNIGIGMTAHGSGLLFEDSFESYSLNKWSYSGTHGTLTNSPSRAGNYAVKFDLNRTKSKVPFRSELTINKGHLFEMGEEYWVGASIFIPNGWVNDKINYDDILLQWHSVPDVHLGESWGGRNPPLSLSIVGKEWKLKNLWDSKPVTINRNYSGKKAYRLGSFQTGQWTDWVFRIKWSYKNDGILEVWKNGQKVISQSGPNTFNDKQAPYLKIGIYKPAWNPTSKWAKPSLNTRTVYHDEIRIAGSKAGYNDVAPGRKRR